MFVYITCLYNNLNKTKKSGTRTRNSTLGTENGLGVGLMAVLTTKRIDSDSNVGSGRVFRRLHEAGSGLFMAGAFAVGMAACGAQGVPGPGQFRRDGGMDATADVARDAPATDGRMLVDGGNERMCGKEGKVTTVTQNGEPVETNADTCKAEEADGGTVLSERTAVKFTCAPDGRTI